MATDYLKALGICYPDAEAYIVGSGDPTVYSNIQWITAPIDQVDLEACALESPIDDVVGEIIEIVGDPEAGDSITWNAITEMWEVEPISIIQSPVIQGKTTTDFTLFDTFTDVSFDQLDVESDPDVIVRLNATQQQVLQAGVFFVYYNMQVQASGSTRTTTVQILKNNLSVLSGGEMTANTYQNEIIPLSRGFVVALSAGDVITMQTKCDSNQDVTVIAPASFTIIKLDGVRGPKGAPGTGTTLIMQDEGTLVGTFDTVNFVGDNVTATEVAGVLQVDVSGSGGGSTVAKLYHHNGTSTQTFTNNWITMQFNTSVRSDVGYTHGGGDTSIAVAGWYDIEYDVSTTCSSGKHSITVVKLQVNSSDVDGAFAYGYHKNASGGHTTMSASIMHYFNAGDVIKVQAKRKSGSATITTIAQSCRFKITKVD